MEKKQFMTEMALMREQLKSETASRLESQVSNIDCYTLISLMITEAYHKLLREIGLSDPNIMLGVVVGVAGYYYGKVYPNLCDHHF
jgi:hypothetical protein